MNKGGFSPPLDLTDPDRPLVIWGLSRRKRSILRRFLGGVEAHYAEHARLIAPGTTLLLWGSTPPPAGLPQDTQFIRIEDGFIRSVGLGADLVQPLSWVFDTRGMYYDATGVSDLEHLLQNGRFEAGLLARAAALRGRIVESGITKYNLSSGIWNRPKGASRVILIPGQVESDASIKFGAPGVATNMALLKAVRQAHPDAYLVYKPHPDVVAGLRSRGNGEGEASDWCDEVIGDVAIGELFPKIDELHLMTSLTGFEALLRNIPVTCYGQPFYSGWGLTVDLLPVGRRTRKLELDELVAGALILYPRYVSMTSGRQTAPEQALEELLEWRGRSGQITPWRRLKRVFLRRIVGVR